MPSHWQPPHICARSYPPAKLAATSHPCLQPPALIAAPHRHSQLASTRARSPPPPRSQLPAPIRTLSCHHTRTSARSPVPIHTRSHPRLYWHSRPSAVGPTRAHRHPCITSCATTTMRCDRPPHPTRRRAFRACRILAELSRGYAQPRPLMSPPSPRSLCAPTAHCGSLARARDTCVYRNLRTGNALQCARQRRRPVGAPGFPA